MPNTPAPLLQGTLDLIVLQLLHSEPTNGYDLSLRIQAISRDVLQVNAGSLYPALYRLEGRGWITAEWGLSETKRRVKFYRLTPAGRERLVVETAQWGRFAETVARILHTPAERPA